MVDFVERNPKNPDSRSGPKPPPPASGRPKPKKILEHDIGVTCPGCGRAFSVLPALAGSEAVCPGCSKPVQVPATKGSADTGLKKPDAEAPLRNKPKPTPAPGEKKAEAADGPDGETKKPSIRKVREKVDLKTQAKCPECEAVLEKDAVLCVKCGYDMRKKQQNVTSRKKKINPVIPIVVLLALVGGSYAVYQFVLKPGAEDAAPAKEATKPIPQEPDPDSIPDAAPTPEPIVEEPVAMIEPEPVVEVVPEPKPVQKPEPVAKAPSLDPREQVRGLMAGKIDQQYPLASVGETVTLTTLDGAEHSGSLTSVDGATIRLQQNGIEVDLPKQDLERLSRARLDTEYRTEMIDQVTDRYLERKAAAN